MNKYQKALLGLTQSSYVEGNTRLNKLNEERLMILQELVDNYQRIEKSLDKACKELAKLEKLFLDAGGYEEFGCKEERWKEWLLNEK